MVLLNENKAAVVGNDGGH